MAVSTPQDPRGEGAPYNPYGQPGGYRAGQQPGQYTSSPLAGQPYQTYPGPQLPQGQPPQPHGYDPYSGTGPAGFGAGGPEPAKRPGLMVLALVLMVLAALPFLVGGVYGLVAVNAGSIPPELLTNPELVQAGATPALLVQAVRLVCGIMLAIALVYIAAAVLAFRGRNAGRIIATVLTVAFVLLLLGGLAGGAAAGGLIGFVAFLVVATVGSVVILFLPVSNAFFSRR